MNRSIILFSIVLCFFSCKQNPNYLKFDSDVPDLTPKVFAKNIINLNNEHVGYCEFSNDGSELYYTVTTDKWFPTRLLKVFCDNLLKKDTLNLIESDFEGEPCFSKDGKIFFFTAVVPPSNNRWHSDIFYMHKFDDGWSNPIRLDTLVNSISSEWNISCTIDDVIYFASERAKGTNTWNGDIYKAKFIEGKVQGLEKLPEIINTDYHESDPLIAPDESFLIFHSNRPGGFGIKDKDVDVVHCDLYISFNVDGKWTKPKNMGSEINTSGIEMAPALTPDGKYFLFTRRESIITSKPSLIYWVSTKIFKKYRD
jgi:Tol biopolymer transport system component